MSDPSYHNRIRQNPKFAAMVSRRTRFALLLSMLVLVPYYSFMMVIAFQPDLLRQTMGEGIATIGWPIGVVLVVGSWLLTGVYVRRANGEFDRMNEEVLKESWK